MQRRTLFADSGYWIAIMFPGDQLHQQARQMATTLTTVQIVTTQMVLTEALNFMSDLGEFRRRFAVQTVQRLEDNPEVEIVPQTEAQFRAAVEYYAARSDQRWSLTDCASFLLMEERGLTEALAYDRDFEQAGFVALLRDGEE